MATLEDLNAQIAELEGQISTSMQQGAQQGGDMSAFYKSPGYQFRMDEGVRALDRSASAKGTLMSGGQQRELTRYGQGIASGEFNNYANRLASLAGIGQTATQQTGRMGADAGNQMGQTIMSGGQAQGEGIMGASNAWQTGFQGAATQIGAGIQQYAGARY